MIAVQKSSEVDYSPAYARFAWGVIGYTLLIILWGAFVRATGSGAGCGSHWPTCNGDIIPRPESIETIIEFSHRVTSAILGPLVIALVAWSVRRNGWNHRVTWGAILSLIFTLIEGGIGAALVIFERVADDASTARALWMGAHLINTFILMGVLVVTAWWAGGGQRLTLRQRGSIPTILLIGMLGLLVLSALGAVTALGDTLFPAETFAEGAAAKFDPEAHFSVRARIWHPTAAVAVSLYLIVILQTVPEFSSTPLRRRWQRINLFVIIFQLGFGTVNALLAAPIVMQLGHLLLANAVWIALLLLSFLVLEDRPAETRFATEPAPEQIALDSH